MEVSQVNDSFAEKELRKKRLEELRQKRELKKNAMDEVAKGAGAVSAGPSRFASNVIEMSVNQQGVGLPPRPSLNTQSSAIIPPIPVSSTRSERRMPNASGQTFESPINHSGTTKVRPKYSVTSEERRAKRREKSSKLDKKEKYLMYLERGAWAFCLFLFVRLVFADRGIVDYYQRKSLLSARQGDYIMISDENQELINEISLLKKDKIHQKKTIREHLGFIAQDEYLVLVD